MPFVLVASEKPGTAYSRAQDSVLVQKNEASTRNYLFHSDDEYALIEAVDPEWQGALPCTLLIAPGGEVVYRHMGAIDPLEVKRAIVDHLGQTY